MDWLCHCQNSGAKNVEYLGLLAMYFCYVHMNLTATMFRSVLREATIKTLPAVKRAMSGWRSSWCVHNQIEIPGMGTDHWRKKKRNNSCPKKRTWTSFLFPHVVDWNGTYVPRTGDWWCLGAQGWTANGIIPKWDFIACLVVPLTPLVASRSTVHWPSIEAYKPYSAKPTNIRVYLNINQQKIVM